MDEREKLIKQRDTILDLIEEMHDELEAEHHSLPSDFFGRPRKRQHQIIGASRILAKLHKKIALQEPSDGS